MIFGCDRASFKHSGSGGWVVFLSHGDTVCRLALQRLLVVFVSHGVIVDWRSLLTAAVGCVVSHGGTVDWSDHPPLWRLQHYRTGDRS